MKLIRNVFELEPDWPASVVTLGTFDGFHKGHQALLKRLKRYGQRFDMPTVVVTYHPNPALVIKPDKNSAEIFSQQEKISLLQDFNPDFAAMIEFTRDLSKKSAAWYLNEVLLKRLRAKYIIIGYDHTFGRGRKGNYKFLKVRQKKYDFHVTQVKPVRLFGRPASSTAIRTALAKGDVTAAAKILGRPFFVTGTVIQGQQRGRTIGFPTANIYVPDRKIVPAIGVYSAVTAYGGKMYRSMVNIGMNPTFEKSGSLHMEVHILDFKKTIYGDTIRTYFIKRIRDEQKFASADELKSQLEKDKKVASAVALGSYRNLADF